MEQPVNFPHCRSAKPVLFANCAIVTFAVVQTIAAQPLDSEWQSKLDAAIGEPRKFVMAVNTAQEQIKSLDAPAYGDWLLGIIESPPSRSKRSLGKSRLTYADNRLFQLPDRDRKTLKSRIDLLRRFDTALAAISITPATSTQPEAADLNDAAADLAEYLDDPDAALAESARLWQAAAYWRAGNSERALKTLRPIVSDPVDPRIGLVSRLFRIRLLAQSGQPAAALAHCNRIANRIDRWFSDYSEETRESARTAVRAMQIRIYEAWNAGLDKSSPDAADGESVAARLAQLKKNFTPPDADKRFRLKSVIGGLKPVELSEDKPAATTQPAD